MKTHLILSLLLSLSLLGHAADDLIVRKWEVPRMFPIVVVVENEPGPFGKENARLLDLSRFNAAEVKEWLMESGAEFSGASFARYDPRSRSLVVRNTPENLEIIDLIIRSEFPVEGVAIVLKDFLERVDGKEPVEAARIATEYPGSALGPIGSIARTLDSLEKSIASVEKHRPDARDALDLLRKKKENLLKILPRSVKLTEDYLKKLTDTLETMGRLQEGE